MRADHVPLALRERRARARAPPRAVPPPQAAEERAAFFVEMGPVRLPSALRRTEGTDTGPNSREKGHFSRESRSAGRSLRGDGLAPPRGRRRGRRRSSLRGNGGASATSPRPGSLRSRASSTYRARFARNVGRSVSLATPLPGMSLWPNCRSTCVGVRRRTSRQCPSQELFELLPPRARLRRGPLVHMGLESAPPPAAR